MQTHSLNEGRIDSREVNFPGLDTPSNSEAFFRNRRCHFRAAKTGTLNVLLSGKIMQKDNQVSLSDNTQYSDYVLLVAHKTFWPKIPLVLLGLLDSFKSNSETFPFPEQ